MRDTVRAVRDYLSIGVLVPATYLVHLTRPSRSPTRRAYFAGLRFRRQAAGWSRDRKTEWMLERLRLVVRRAYRETTYYRETFDRVGFDPRVDFSFDDFAGLPVLGRDDVQQAGPALISDAVPADERRRDATGGSSGRPTEIWMGPAERGWRESANEWFMERLGMPVGTRIAGFWGHHLDPSTTDSLRMRMYGLINNTKTFNCFRISDEILEDYHRRFERWRPSCIVAYAGALGHLAEYVLDRGYRPTYPTRRLITGAEKLLPQHRRAVEEAFGKPVHERYGSRDVGSIGYQMDPAHSHDFELDWADVLVEPEADADDASILVTKLHADAMPMLRYRIDDLGRFPAGSRRGHPTFSLREVVGRTTDGVWLPDGRWVHGIEFPHLLKDHPVREFLLHQRPDYSVRLMIAPKKGFGDGNLMAIRHVVTANLPGLDFDVVLVDEVPHTRANKWRPVITEVPLKKRPA